MIPSAPSLTAFVRPSGATRQCTQCPTRTEREECPRCLQAHGRRVATFAIPESRTRAKQSPCAVPAAREEVVLQAEASPARKRAEASRRVGGAGVQSPASGGRRYRPGSLRGRPYPEEATGARR